MGGTMTAISLEGIARLTRLSGMTTPDAVEVDRSSRDNGRYQIGHGRLRAHRVGRVAFRQQEHSGGFVDFLLGRCVRHPR
jgi:hypothetical protein